MRLGIGAKLTAVTLGLLVLLTAGALLSVRHFFGQQLRQQAVRELRSASRVLTSVIQRSGDQLLERGRLLAELPSVRTAMAKDPAQLEPLLLEVKAIRAANLLWATDSRGVVLAGTGEYPPPGENLAANPLIRSALDGNETLGFDLFQGEWWLLLNMPVKEAESSRVIGSVTLALLIGEAYLARLSELLGTQIGCVWGEHQIWSEGFPAPARPEITSHLTQGLGGKPRELLTSGQDRLLWLATPVTGGSPPILTGPIAVLGIRLDESVIQRTTRAIGWISLMTMGIGVILTIAAIRPITRQLEEAQAMLLQAEKMASVGQMAAGVAHELNNPLMVIMGNTQLALRMLTRSPKPLEPQRKEFIELLESLDQESHRSKMIVGNLLDFSRVRPPTRAETDLHALLDDSLRLVGHQAGLQAVQVAKNYRKDLPRVQADPAQLKQVFLNVILNAVQAMPEGGTLTLETGLADPFVRVVIRDTGIGIPEDKLPKVFEPFFTTKEVGSGTGLGLFISYGIIQRHGGTIQIASQVGKGTATTISLPLKSP